MNKQTISNLVARSGLGLALALAIWSPIQTRSEEPADAKGMMDGKMMENCREMKEQKQKMAGDAKIEDAQLTKQLTEMNRAPDDKKMGLMSALVTEMVEQRISRDARTAKMDEEMMQHMMQHMQMGKGSMSHCPMMQGMKGMKGTKGTDEAAEDVHQEHQEDPK